MVLRASCELGLPEIVQNCWVCKRDCGNQCERVNSSERVRSIFIVKSIQREIMDVCHFIQVALPQPVRSLEAEVPTDSENLDLIRLFVGSYIGKSGPDCITPNVFHNYAYLQM